MDEELKIESKEDETVAKKSCFTILLKRWCLLSGILFVIIVLVLIVIIVAHFPSSQSQSQQDKEPFQEGNVTSLNQTESYVESIEPSKAPSEYKIQTTEESMEPSVTEMSMETLPGGHILFSKLDWSGKDPTSVRQLRHPTPFIVISHTATASCFSDTTCIEEVKDIQTLHMGPDLKFPDIGYSFLVGGDGNVYEGRGWDATNMHTGFVRRCNIGIGFIGNFIKNTPTNGQLEATKELINLGVKLGKLSTDYKLVPMNVTYLSLSPGEILYGIIKNWPRFWVPTDNDKGTCPYEVE